MAGIDLIHDARARLEDSLLNFESLVQSWLDMTGESPSPAWLFLLKQHQAALSDLTYEYVHLVHQHALPLVKDMQAFTKRGDGGRGPHDGKSSGKPVIHVAAVTQ